MYSTSRRIASGGSAGNAGICVPGIRANRLRDLIVLATVREHTSASDGARIRCWTHAKLRA